MSNSPLSYGPRSKNACEPCRRKKTKCPGEQPSCSFCERLNQKCTYTSQTNSGRVQKARPGPQSQISRLQAQVDHMNHTIQSLTKQPRFDPDMTTRDSRQKGLQANHLPSENGALESGGSRQRLDASDCPLPSPEVMSQLVEIYRCKIHLQPFPLFDVEHLSAQWPQWPLYLLQSFLAASLATGDPSCHNSMTPNTMYRFYQLARGATIPAATDGTSNIPLLQSLCLLTICDISGKNEHRASMNINMATNLIRRMLYDSRSADRNSFNLKEDGARCFWTIFILERTFTRGPWTLQLDTPLTINIPYVQSPPIPPNIRQSEPLPQDKNPHLPQTTQNSNILVSCFHLLSIWGRINEYAGQLHLGLSEEAWLTPSVYSGIGADFFKFETSFSQIHRFKNTGLTDRTPEEIAEFKEYWASWLLLQTTFHAGHALLNHPLLHFLRHDCSAKERRAFQPPSFIQQTIDQALLHAGWISRLIRTFRDMEIQVNDPVIGHQVITSATIHWIFASASDSHIAEQAISDLDQCLQFLRDITCRWPQFAEKVDALEKLEILTKQPDGGFGRRGLPSSITSILWKLIDPCILGIDITAFPRLNTSDERIPTEHLAKLHESSRSSKQGPTDVSQNTDDELSSFNLPSYSGFMMNDALIYPESLSGSLDFQFYGQFGYLGGLISLLCITDAYICCLFLAPRSGSS